MRLSYENKPFTYLLTYLLTYIDFQNLLRVPAALQN